MEAGIHTINGHPPSHETTANAPSKNPPPGIQIWNLIFVAWVLAAESIKTLYVTTCDCQDKGQPFNAWFFPAFHHWPYTFWWTYHGITWLAGPYSLIWWGLNSPAIIGYYAFFGYLLVVDVVVFLLLRYHSGLYSLYFLTLTLWFTTVDPVDFFPVVFAVYGRYRRLFLFLAPIVKLPVGAPVWVWTWTFTNANSLQGPENYGRYLILGTVWLVSLILYLTDKTYVAEKLLRRLHRLNPPRPSRTSEGPRYSSLHFRPDESSQSLADMVCLAERSNHRMLWHFLESYRWTLQCNVVLDDGSYQC